MTRIRGLATAAFSLALFGAAQPLHDDKGKTLADMPGGAYRLDTAHTELYFMISHVGFSRTHGRFDRYEGSMDYRPSAPEMSPVKVTMETASIDLNEADLETELTSPLWLDAATYPQTTFVSRKLELTSPTTGRLTGDLTLHGVTRPVVLDVTLNKFLTNDKTPKFNRFGFTAKGVLKRSDFGITRLPLVGDEVTLDMDAEFTKTD